MPSLGVLCDLCGYSISEIGFSRSLNPNAEIKSQEQTEETEREALARTHTGTFSSTKDARGMSSDTNYVNKVV